VKRDKQDNSAEPQDTRSTRREILRGGLLIAGAAAVARVAGGGPKEAQAASGSPLILGQPNDATSATTLTVSPGVSGLVVSSSSIDPNQPDGTVEAVSALRGIGGDGVGVHGTTTTGVGVFGSSINTDPNQPVNGIGVFGSSINTDPNMPLSGIGVFGQAGTSISTDPNQPIFAGVYGSSVEAIGVGGRSLENYGVLGQTGESPVLDPNQVFPFAGIIGLGGSTGDPNTPNDFAGVIGFTADPNMPGVLAWNSTADGLALNVQGRALFSSAGTGTIAAGSDRVSISHPAVTSSSIVLVTLSSDPIGGRRLKFARVKGGGFDVVLSSKAKTPVSFGFLVVN